MGPHQLNCDIATMIKGTNLLQQMMNRSQHMEPAIYQQLQEPYVEISGADRRAVTTEIGWRRRLLSGNLLG